MKFSGFLLLFAATVLSLNAVIVDPARAVIVVAPEHDAAVQLAARELQKNIKIITGKKIPIFNKEVPGKYLFLMGKPAGVKLQPEEAVWEITPRYTRLYGDSSPAKNKKIVLEELLNPSSKSGDLSAVFAFLEDQLGIIFKAPGPMGLSYTPAKVLKLKAGKYNWVPILNHRYLWPDRMLYYTKRYDTPQAWQKDRRASIVPAEFVCRTKEEYRKKMFECWLWLKQQRIGRSERYAFGHAFGRWWSMYGKKHPEYFALVKGKRRPPVGPSWVKLCVSNPAVWKQIVANWAKQKNRRPLINVCENDGLYFCECKNCRALDMPPLPGKKWDEDLSDRYIYFSTQVLKEARKIDPKVQVCHYAYSVFRFPPRREKVDPAIIIGFVPRMLDLDINEEMYKGWYNAGARQFFLRPNDLHVNTPLPMGFDKHIFTAFKMGIKYGIKATCYDSLHGFWDISGLSDYLIARGNVDPTKDFEHWMKEYCSIYGAAAPEVRQYYDHWRVNIWEKQLWPNRRAIAAKGVNDNFRRGLMWDIHKYYKESDFDKTDAFLRAGLKKKLNPVQKRHLEQLLLANKHARLTYRAMAGRGKAKARAAVALLKFRRANKEKLNINWERLTYLEMSFGDAAGTKAAYLQSDYDDFNETSVHWFFKPDPAKVGEKEKWELTSGEEIRRSWKRVRVDTQWENQRHHPDADFRKMMKDYDGIGYYGITLAINPSWKGKEVALLFGAVDESAWVWLNGKFSGKRLHKNHNDWSTPFAINITDQIDWRKKHQTVVVKVEDTNGSGGIWRGVMIGVRKK